MKAFRDWLEELWALWPQRTLFPKQTRLEFTHAAAEIWAAGPETVKDFTAAANAWATFVAKKDVDDARFLFQNFWRHDTWRKWCPTRRAASPPEQELTATEEAFFKIACAQPRAQA